MGNKAASSSTVPSNNDPEVGIQHNARHHVSSNYILPADDAERDRLQRQHRIMTDSFGGRLVLAPIILKPGDRVLDSGSGAASWLLDFAKTVPSTVEIHAVDISPRLFPLNTPSNVHFLEASVTQLPREWTSTFNLVNQKLLLAALSAAAWQAAFAEMYRVLVPGGWVNLIELNGDLNRMEFKHGPAAKKMMTLVREIFRSGNSLADAVYHLPGWLEQAGFINIRTEMRISSMAGVEGKPMRENCYEVYMAMKTPALKAGGLGFVKSEEEYDNLVQAMREELEVTENAGLQSFMICAQKPAVAKAKL
ncbi:hypothetical protein HWV62_2057 [Athelia sp. TMB]|nr:hypothetical protein HWV62_2057 [Athelia sp. TMB]